MRKIRPHIQHTVLHRTAGMWKKCTICNKTCLVNVSSKSDNSVMTEIVKQLIHQNNFIYCTYTCTCTCINLSMLPHATHACCMSIETVGCKAT